MSRTARNVRRLVFVLLVLVVLVASVFAVLHLSRTEPPPSSPETRKQDYTPSDPRLTYETPYRNVKPDVKYVGDAACEVCHAGICKSYHAHPMGRSAEYLSKAPVVEKFPATGPVTTTSGPLELRVEKSADGVTHHVRVREATPTPVQEAVIPVQVAIGSGTRGRSYLSVKDGFAWQSPVSWYGPQEKWDVSPGFDLGRSLTWPTDTPCLYCHTDAMQPVAGVENHFREPLYPRQAAIGCERCHGPGELHVAERSGDLSPRIPDTSIVNPRHLPLALQQAVCEQCHLQGKERVVRRGRELYDFRPGLPFEPFVSVFVQPPGSGGGNNSVGQFEQMEQSQCFIRSGRMTCTTCHDPHASPAAADRDAHYRRRCQTCHDQPTSAKCSAPAAERTAKADNCVTCHMPKSASTSIAHASVTNHRIPKTAAAPVQRPDPFATAPLVRFRPGLGLSRAEQDRDLAIALVEFGGTKLPDDPGVRSSFRVFAVNPLKTAVARSPDDTAAWVALSRAQLAVGDTTEAVKSAQSAARSSDDSETALSVLTEVGMAAGEHQLVIDAATRWSAINPQSPDPLFVRAIAHFSRKDWAKSEADWRAVLKINPVHIKARLHLAVCRYRQGDSVAAEQESQTAAKLETDATAREGMLTWYRQATK